MSEEPDAEAPEAPEVTAAVDDQIEVEAAGEGVEGEADDQPEPEADELEEVDWEGKKVRVSPEVKAALMRTVDYTRKTQSHAEAVRNWEQQRTQQAESFEALRADYGKVHAIEQQAQAYAGVNWPNEFAADPDNARVHYDQYRLIQDSLDTAKKELSAKETQRLESQRQSAATAIEETRAVLVRDIKGWGPELAQKLIGLAREYGVTEQELGSNPNPRDWKILHELHNLRQQVKKQTTAQRQEASTSIEPARTVVARRAPNTGLHDNLDPAEWVKRRNAQLSPSKGR